jgi:hypothetical protein
MCEDDNTPLDKMASIGYDGASVMTGEKAGLGEQLAALQPFIIRHHDAAHREALACADAVESESPWQQSNIIPTLESDMNTVVSDHNRSTVKIKKLASNQKELQTHMVRLHHGAHTRWLTRNRMSTGIFDSIAPLHKEYVEDRNDSRAALVTTLTFVSGTAYHADLTAKMCLLSKVLQKDHVRYKMIKSVVAATCTGLSAAYVDLGEDDLPGGRRLHIDLIAMLGVLNAMDDGQEQQFDHGPDGYRVAVLFNQDKWQQLLRVFTSYAKSQVQCLQRRFPDDEFMEAFDALDPADFPRPLPTDDPATFKRRLMQHGADAIAKLAAEYGHAKKDADGVLHAAKIEAGKIYEEYEMLKGVWWSLEEREAAKPPALKQVIGHEQLLEYLCTQTDPTVLPNIKMLMALEAAQALTTSCCELGISTLGIIKTKLRNRFAAAAAIVLGYIVALQHM